MTSGRIRPVSVILVPWVSDFYEGPHRMARPFIFRGQNQLRRLGIVDDLVSRPVDSSRAQAISVEGCEVGQWGGRDAGRG
jgi:hypothetical protein